MFSFNIFIPLFFFFILYLLIQIIKASLLFLYLVQLKEYRLDRIKAHFKTISGRNQIFDYINLLKWRAIYRPRFTGRAFLILFFTFIAQYNVFFFILRFSFHLFRAFSGAVAIIIFIAFLFVNLITPALIFFFSFASSIIIWPIKELVVFLAAKKMKQAGNLLVIGVTGSYGKTSVKEILGFILSGFFRTIKTPSNCNTLFGIAIFILKKLRRNHEVFVVEMGAYRKGEIEKICKMALPKVGILTGIDEQHLELFGSLSNTQWAKFELIKSLPKNGLAVFNAKNNHTRRLFKMTKKPKVFYGQKNMRFKTLLIGDWQRENIQAAVAVCDFLKLPRSKVFERLAELKTPRLAIEIKKGIKESRIINDSYNANPTVFLAALKLLKKTPGKTKILITPGIIELGKSSDKVHKKIGSQAEKICSKIFLSKSDFEEPIKKGINKNKQDGFLEVERDEVELLEKLKPFLGKRTVILLEGRLPFYLVKKLCRSRNSSS